MDFEIAFYVVIAFVLGYCFGKSLPIYIGTNKEKYEKANFGILLRERK